MNNLKKKKLPHELSDQELLEHVSSSNDTALKSQQQAGSSSEQPSSSSDPFLIKDESILPDFFAFLQVYKISEGTYEVKTGLLYKLYKVWSKDPISKSKFIELLRDNFKTGENSCIKINSNSILISKQIYAIAKDKTKPKYKSAGNIKHLQAFITKFNLEPGDYVLEDYVLFHFYDKWCYDTGKTPLNILGFCILMNKNFKYKTDTKKGIFYYLIKKEFVNGKEATIERVKEGWEKAKAKGYRSRTPRA